MIHTSLSPIRADGSDRKFERIMHNGKSAVRILPSDTEAGAREAHSFFRIGTHLFAAGLPVPAIYEFDRRSSAIVVEDLGDTLLYDAASRLKEFGHTSELVRIYKQAVRLLCDFQYLGTENFDTAWCYDTPVYDGNFAWEREAVYFMDSFLLKHCGIMASESLVKELKRLCAGVDEQRDMFCIMHRDFQSRNLMLHGGMLGIIDFQGARFGPWAYDLASLVYDPYIDLSEDMRTELVEFYLDYRSANRKMREEMLRNFHFVALLRTLQVLGAFSFLSREKARPFFVPFINPALRNLNTLVHKECFSGFTSLRALCVSLLNTDR